MKNAAPFKNVRVLIIDDEAEIRTMLANSIRSFGYEPETASSAEEALRIFAKENYNVVVTDIKMGKMDGIELSLQLRAKYPALAIIIATGFPSNGTVRAAEKLSAIQYIVKPIDMGILSNSLAAAVRWNTAQLILRAAEKYVANSAEKSGNPGERVQKAKAAIKNLIVQESDISLLNEFSLAEHPLATDLYKRLAVG